ncbi:hypothetical protein FQN60_017450 [Etheostoma spectabile]|uniref:Uncharacterized protein n=1 Tax=Etheostoma spectabile TaxID=54343 RepID=A0A5J5C9I5_9PERO|nr:hypothetical protein FQN60_017450 [Etheostoma spectabile]
MEVLTSCPPKETRAPQWRWEFRWRCCRSESRNKVDEEALTEEEKT